MKIYIWGIMFLAKEKENFRSVVDYRALNLIKKRKTSPLPRPEIFDRLGEELYLSKLEIKTGFHQLRVLQEDIVET